MAVTDLTDSLPYWARGAGPTGGPAAAPQGGSDAAPPAGVSMQDWLTYLQQMMGISSANAGTQDINAALNKGGSPVPSALANGGPPVPPSFAQTPPPPPAASQLRPPGITQPTGVSASGSPLQPGSLSPAALAQFGAGAPTWPSGGGSANPTAAPPPGQQAPGGFPGPMAGGGAGGQGATSNPRFVGVDRPNADPTARRGSPQMTALNLAGLFGRGQPAVNPNAPAAAAQPVSAQRPVPGPLANAPMPPVMPPDIRNKRVANAVAQPNWWQNL